MANLPPPVLEKVRAAGLLLDAPYTINKTLYDNVYITSDIHCDLIKLDMLLSNSGLITKPNPNAAHPPSVDIINNTIWVAPRTLFIIVGDIVDGSRTDDYYNVLSSIPDAKGNIELLLHAYLYNLRIKARLVNSEVRFTVGNHDYHSVIKQREDDWPNFYERWVHDSAQEYFQTRARRRACLMPFYRCCFYLVVAVDDEIGCIHGGFRIYNRATTGFDDITPTVLDIQDLIDTHGYDGITAEAHALLTNIGSGPGGKEESPLWSRAYAKYPLMCEDIDFHYKMVVVGHCQMGGLPSTCGSAAAHTASILATDPYTKYGCGGPTGCVVVGCSSATGPHLAFVDIGFSRTFSSPGQNEAIRRAEVLHLSHDPALDTTNRYYNVITRKNIGAAAPMNLYG
jgi:hypothetical protein